MAIAVGDKIPQIDSLKVMTADGPQSISTDDIFAGKKVVMFAVPGAFTPTCSSAHVPGFVANADKIMAKGVDSIVCTSVNDAFVMGAWGDSQNAEALTMVADGNGDLAQALGLTLDLTGGGLGHRSRRYAMIVNNGVIEAINVDEGGAMEVSDAETMMQLL